MTRSHNQIHTGILAAWLDLVNMLLDTGDETGRIREGKFKDNG